MLRGKICPKQPDLFGMLTLDWKITSTSIGAFVRRILAESYESKHHPVDPPDPFEAIKFRMEQMNLTRKDIEPLIGSRGRVSEVSDRRRSLSLPMIRRLHTTLHIPLESLIRKFDVRG
jgi:HTH-type transcriptional regulator/antitoxin HigA